MMKIRITIEADLDLVGWGDEYGMRGPTDIKSDVMTYVRSQIDESAAGQENLISVTEIKISERRT